MKILTEKHRPETFDGLAGQDHIKSKLQELDVDELQHLMFLGRAGVGKTTTAHILKNQMFDEGSKDMNFMELNASNDRGIDTIREEVTDFAKTKPTGAEKNILFLDEADSLTKSAQQALRRIMEKYSDNCIFILSGNYEDQFIDPIKSRCLRLKFEPIDPEDIMERLEDICDEEGVEYDQEDIRKIAEESDGDMRQAINTLWFSVEDEKVVPKKIETPVEQMEVLVDELAKANYLSAKEEKDRLMKQGIEPQKLISLFYEFIEQDEQIDNQAKAIWMEELSDADWRMSRDTIKELQLERMIWKIAKKTGEMS